MTDIFGFKEWMEEVTLRYSPPSIYKLSKVIVL